MIKLHPEEKIALIVRQDWFALIGRFFISLFLISSFLILVTSISEIISFLGLDLDFWEPIGMMLSAFWGMVVFLMIFLFWVGYYLNLWIITDKRIIDVVQLGLLSRKISETPLSVVQNVTTEVKGFLQTVIGFGTLRVKTLGGLEFTMDKITELHEAQEAILKNAGLK